MDFSNSGNYFSRTEYRTLQILVNSGPLTKAEIARLLPASERTIHRALNALHSAHAVFVREYKANPHGHASRVWQAGVADDAEPPTAKTGTQRSRLFVRRLSAEERDFLRARNRALARKPRRDRITKALFGPAPRTIEERK